MSRFLFQIIFFFINIFNIVLSLFQYFFYFELKALLKAMKIKITLIRHLREVCAVDSIIIIILFKKNQTRVPGRPSLADPSDTIETVSPLCIHPFTPLPPLCCPPIICTRAPTNYFIRTSFTDEGKCRRIDLFNLRCLRDAPVNVYKWLLFSWSFRDNSIFQKSVKSDFAHKNIKYYIPKFLYKKNNCG